LARIGFAGAGFFLFGNPLKPVSGVSSHEERFLGQNPASE
jgi:hypothetical protein